MQQTETNKMFPIEKIRSAKLPDEIDPAAGILIESRTIETDSEKLIDTVRVVVQWADDPKDTAWAFILYAHFDANGDIVNINPGETEVFATKYLLEQNEIAARAAA